jgi:Leucine-rich repeat (LRR) protein
MGLLIAPSFAASGGNISGKFTDPAFRAAVYEALGKQAGASITAAECAKVDHYINCSGMKNLNGLEYFTSLEYLYLSKGQLESVDWSRYQFKRLNLDGVTLQSIDMSGNVNLLSLNILGCTFESLDISKCVNLEYLGISGCNLKSLDISSNTSLDGLTVRNCGLTSLDVSHNINLTELYCEQNKLKTLDISKLSKLGDINCSDNLLTSLSTLHNPLLWGLVCERNRIKKLDITALSNLSDLRCAGNRITALRLPKNNARKISIDCSQNWLYSLDADKTKVQSLNCAGNIMRSTKALKGVDGLGNNLTFSPQRSFWFRFLLRYLCFGWIWY